MIREADGLGAVMEGCSPDGGLALGGDGGSSDAAGL